MGGVDIYDQLQSYYTTQITTVRTRLPLFFWALNTAIINAYIISKEIFRTSRKPFQSHRRFRIRLAWNLIIMGSRQMGLNEHETERLLRQSSPKYGQYQPGIGPGHKNIGTNRRTTYVTAKTPLPTIRKCKTRTHRSIKSFTRKQGYKGPPRCWMCRWKEAKKLTVKIRQTVYECEACRLPLCLRCFDNFHSIGDD